MSEAQTELTPALPSSPTDDLWTADSERSPTPEPLPDPEPDPAPETPLVAAAPETAAPAVDEKGKKPGKPRNDPIARMQQATAKEAAAKEEARLAREEATALKARLDALEQRTLQPEPPRQAPSAKFPTFDEWQTTHPDDTWEDYQDARVEWKLEARDAARAAQQQVTQYREQLESAKATDPTLVQALKNDPPVSPVMEQAILSSKQSIDIVRYLGTHPEICAQLALESRYTSGDAVPVMRRYLEAQVTAGAVARPDSAPAVRPSTANPPINRVGGTASATPVDPDDLDFGPEYIRQENAREKKRQEASRW